MYTSRTDKLSWTRRYFRSTGNSDGIANTFKFEKLTWIRGPFWSLLDAVHLGNIRPGNKYKKTNNYTVRMNCCKLTKLVMGQGWIKSHLAHPKLGHIKQANHKRTLNILLLMDLKGNSYLIQKVKLFQHLLTVKEWDNIAPAKLG